MKIYLINPKPGDEAEASTNDPRMANALKPFGFIECTRAQWLAMKAKIRKLDNLTTDQEAETDERSR